MQDQQIHGVQPSADSGCVEDQDGFGGIPRLRGGHLGQHRRPRRRWDGIPLQLLEAPMGGPGPSVQGARRAIGVELLRDPRL
ncbi:hypothetical protein [Kocuria palustris]|uniref:hypothetical protein n=1 Tax=Kocuria palustris TaxID=71999 RepID=UPI0021A918C0|nr:hypothetical protein [Kocuria palustris]MCT1590020.1 hypothetical protein [Kocuria palustris]